MIGAGALFCRLYWVFYQREYRLLFAHPRLLMLPVLFFGMCLFLFHYIPFQDGGRDMESAARYGLYMILFFLSTSSALGALMGGDQQGHFLRALVVEKTFVTPYVTSKITAVGLMWTLLFSVFCGGLEWMQHKTLESIALAAVIWAALSFALVSLYTLFDALCRGGSGPSQTSFLGILVVMPFVVPLVLMALMGFEKQTVGALVPMLSYAVLLTVGAGSLTCALIRRA